MKHNQSNWVAPKRVVLLGASGFIGRELKNSLESQGVSVLALGSKDVDLMQKSSVEILKEKIQETDSVVFLSALTPDKGKDAATLIKNVSMAQHVGEFLEQKKVAHMVYISSDAVYADDINPVRETSYTAPSSLYGCMHAARELAVKGAVTKLKTPVAVLRPSAVYGASDTHNSYGPNRFLRTALKDSKITLFGNGEEKRDHIYIDNVVGLITLCLGHVSEGTLNLTTGNSPSFMEVAQEAAKHANPSAKIECNPRSGPITHRHFDITEAIRTFPTFRYTPLSEGIAKTAEALKSR
jgi:UDP-glucose 4-epimerase